MSTSKKKLSKIKEWHFSLSKRSFSLWHAIVKKGPTSPFYFVNLLLWIINYAKIEFSTENVIFDFCQFRKHFWWNIGALLAPLDREFKEVLKTINMPSILDIALLEKSLIEGVKNSKWPQIQSLGSKKPLTAGIEIWQQRTWRQSMFFTAVDPARMLCDANYI